MARGASPPYVPRFRDTINDAFNSLSALIQL